MTVYVDRLLLERGTWSGGAHMVADTTEELEAMARKIGLNPAWIQKPGAAAEHYDLTRKMRSAALYAGAVEVDSREIVRIMQRKRR
jgi:hypothetical protein